MKVRDLCYCSYHNRNINIAFRITKSLIANHANIWLDRLQVSPIEDWAPALERAKTRCSYALVIFSQEYVDSEYCITELQQLADQGSLLIFVIVEDVPLDIIQTYSNKEMVDFRNWDSTPNYSQTIQYIHDFLKPSHHNTNQTPIKESVSYLLEVIAEVEQSLLWSPTGRIATRESTEYHKNEIIRPRGYIAGEFLQNGNYQLNQPDQLSNQLIVEDLLKWLQSWSQMVLVGNHGQGKTTLLQFLILQFAHEGLFQEDDDFPLPLWINLATWHPANTFEEFWQQTIGNYRSIFEQSHWALFFDNFDILNDEQIFDLQVWLNANNQLISQLIFTCQPENTEKISSFSLPILRIQPITYDQIELLVRYYLPEEYENSFLRIITEQIAENLTYDDLIYQVIGIRRNPIVLEEPEILNWQAEAIPTLWENVNMEDIIEYTQPEMEAALAQLATRMLEDGYSAYVPAPYITEILDEKILKLALEAQILEKQGDHIRFSQSVVQDYYVGQQLEIDGIYSRLTRPEFDAIGQRITTKWDKPISFFLDSLTNDEAVLSQLETIAEVDPHLAYQYLQQKPTLIPRLQIPLIHQLLDIAMQSEETIDITHQNILSMSQTNLTITALLMALRSNEWALRKIAYSILQDIDIEIPDNFASQLNRLDRDFPDSTYNFMSQFSQSELALFLIHYIDHENTQIANNAIWLLGQLADTSVVFPLAENLGKQRDSLTEILLSLGKLNDPIVIPVLLQLYTSSDFDTQVTIEQTLAQLHRPITAKFLHLLSQNDYSLPDEISSNLNEFADDILGLFIIIKIAQRRTTKIDVGNWLQDEGDIEQMKRLRELLGNFISQLGKQKGISELADEIEDTLNRKTTQQTNELDRLKQRVRGNTGTTAQVYEHQPAPEKLIQKSAQQTLPDAILSDLQHEDWMIRLKALQQLQEFDAETTIDYIIQATSDEDYQVRIESLKILRHFQAQTDVMSIWLDALEDEHHSVIDTVATLLKKHGPPPIEQLDEKLDTENVDTLAHVIEILGMFGNETIVPELVLFLDDTRMPWLSEKTIGHITARALMTIGADNALRAIQNSTYAQQLNETHLPQFLPPEDDNTATQQTTKQPKKDKFMLALKALHDPKTSHKASRYLREYAQRTKNKTLKPAVFQQLKDSLNDENWIVRWTVVEVLGQFPNPEVIPHLIKRLEDENSSVQIAAIRALVELEAKSSVKAIMQLSDHEETDVREAAVKAMGLLGDRTAMVKLQDMLHDHDQFVRLSVVQSICMLLEEEASPFLLEVIDDDYSHIRWAATKYLAQHPNPDIVPYLAKRLNDHSRPLWEKETISEYAQQALEKIETTESEKILQDWQQSQGTS